MGPPASGVMGLVELKPGVFICLLDCANVQVTSSKQIVAIIVFVNYSATPLPINSGAYASTNALEI